MQPLKIAVISDIHIGEKARCSELSPPGVPSTKRNEEFLAAFSDFAATANITADCLVISGDLSCKADAGEFSHASTVATRIAAALGVTTDNIFYAPGNHDVDWGVLKLAEGATTQARALRWAQRYDPITATTNLFRDRASISATNPFKGNLFSSPFAGIWHNAAPHFFVAINTAAHDCPTQPDHYGYIRAETLKWLYANVPARGTDDDSIRCLILHHHLVPHANLGADAVDLSVCQNGDQLLTMLRDLDFDLVVHGHKHFPRFEIQLAGSDHPIAILGAGSFSADLTQEYGGGVHNQFHLLSVAGRYTDSSRVYGQLNSWAYVFPSGWRPNVSTYTILDHAIGFGGPLNWRELAKMLHHPIRNRALAGRPFELAEIGPIHEHISYVAPETARRAIDEIARQEGLDVAWIPGPTLSAFFR